MAMYVLNEPRFTRETRVVRLRPFASMGEPLVASGDEVTWDTLAGKYTSRKRLRHIRLEASSGKFSATVLVQEGQKVKRGEVLAYYSYLFGLGYTEYTAPCDGEVVAINPVVGAISIKEAPVDLYCHLAGVVEKTDDAMGVWVRTYGGLVQGVAGAGYGRSGRLSVKVDSAAHKMAARDIGASDAGTVILAGRTASQDLLEACLRYQVAGVVAGSVSHRVFDWYSGLAWSLDWDEFLARFWARDAKKKEAAPPPSEIVPALVVTEGFGDLPMGDESLSFLQEHEGKTVHIDGGYYSKEPAIVIPENAGVAPKGWAAGPTTLLAEVKPGSRVSVLGLSDAVREGTVSETVSELRLENGLVVPSAKILLGNGETLLVPLSNVLSREHSR